MSETETCHMHGYTPEKTAYLRRLRLIEAGTWARPHG